MMMSMLAAGGLDAFTDNLRAADEDNPNGYFELERVKQLAKESAWLAEARGRAVKIISSHLNHLPADNSYKILFMRRKMTEILASQRQMLLRRGEPADTVSDERMAQLFSTHLENIETWLRAQPNIEVSYVDYNQALVTPGECADAVNQFLGLDLKVDEMTAVIDGILYRQRR